MLLFKTIGCWNFLILSDLRHNEVREIITSCKKEKAKTAYRGRYLLDGNVLLPLLLKIIVVDAVIAIA